MSESIRMKKKKKEAAAEAAEEGEEERRKKVGRGQRLNRGEGVGAGAGARGADRWRRLSETQVRRSQEIQER